jgi:hypothetical protein
MDCGFQALQIKPMLLRINELLCSGTSAGRFLVPPAPPRVGDWEFLDISGGLPANDELRSAGIVLHMPPTLIETHKAVAWGRATVVSY